MITIQNDYLRATVNPRGAELSSLVRLSDNEEFMWSGNPDVWSGIAPILFPITGVLRDGLTVINDQEYAIPKHGFARHELFSEVSSEPTECRLRLSDNQATQAVYPFNFQFDVVFKLEGRKLSVRYELLNESNGSLPYSVGSHPAFRLPHSDVTRYQLHFDTKTPPILSEVTTEGLVEEGSIPMTLSTTNELPLTPTLFDNDALVFLNTDIRCVTLLEDGIERLRMHWVDTPHLGIWAKPNAAYVCIEPWQSYADSSSSSRQFSQKAGIRSLAPGECAHDGYHVEIL